MVRSQTSATRLEGVLTYSHHKVPFGVVETISANIRAVMRAGSRNTVIMTT